MRQAEDPMFAQMPSRIRLRQATDDDYRRLLERVGVELPDGDETPISIIRRHNLLAAINILRLKQVSAKNGTPLMYCMAQVMEHRLTFNYPV
jgi:hypothetical protein